MLLYPEFFIYKLLNPPKYKKHRPVKIPIATNHYEIAFLNNPIFKNTIVIDKETFNNTNNTHLECPFLYDSNNLFLSYSKKIHLDEQQENHYHWHTPSRSFALTNPAQEIINLKQSHNIDFYQKENTLESGLLDINTIDVNKAKTKVTLITTPFDIDLENKKKHYFETYAYKMALFSLMSKVFLLGVFFHIGLSVLATSILNDMVSSLSTKQHLDSDNKISPFISSETLSPTLAILGMLNKCLNKKKNHRTLLCLGSLLFVTSIVEASPFNRKLVPLGSALISAGLYAISAKKAMIENRVFWFFSKDEFNKVILSNAKNFIDRI